MKFFVAMLILEFLFFQHRFLMWTIYCSGFFWRNSIFVYYCECIWILICIFIFAFISLEVTFVSDWWANVDVTFYGKKEDYEKIGTESAMLMPNHRSDIDWLVGYMIADRNGILGVWQGPDQSHFFIPCNRVWGDSRLGVSFQECRISFKQGTFKLGSFHINWSRKNWLCHPMSWILHKFSIQRELFMLSPANHFFENWLRILNVMGHSKWLNSTVNEA